MTQDFNTYTKQCIEQIDHFLNAQLDDTTRLDEAIRYCVFNGGKRVRPMLCAATAQAFSQPGQSVLPIAGAIELIHAYSLVHDDLPAMDDDDLRRGKPTCHKAYDEATAILVGDALQAKAFELLCLLPDSIDFRSQVKQLSLAAGAKGMVLGQAIDIDHQGSHMELDALKQMHRAKTGALIKASCIMPAMLFTSDSNTLNAIDEYADNIGLAFQIQDDILDVIADTQTLGKPSGSDAESDKPTYTSILGLEGAKQELQLAYESAIQALKFLPGDTSRLKLLADYIVSRIN